MKRGSLIFALLLLSAATFAQTKERTVAEFEVETGIELAEHMRFTIGTNIYNFKKAELLLTIGVAIGGGRKK